MTKQEIVIRMIEASKEDRARFFDVADTLQLQPKYMDRLAELEDIKQQWRDMTTLPDYPQMKWPLELPDWFPKVHFASCWESDYFAKELNPNEEKQEALKV